MGNREKHGKPYFWTESTLFDGCWLIVRRDDMEVIGDVDSKSVAKRFAKELNQLMSIINDLGVEVEMVDDRED